MADSWRPGCDLGSSYSVGPETNACVRSFLMTSMDHGLFLREIIRTLRGSNNRGLSGEIGGVFWVIFLVCHNRILGVVSRSTVLSCLLCVRGVSRGALSLDHNDQRCISVYPRRVWPGSESSEHLARILV